MVGAYRWDPFAPFHLYSGYLQGVFLLPPEAYPAYPGLFPADQRHLYPPAEPRPARWARGRGAGAR